jgi:hypothetical protein
MKTLEANSETRPRRWTSSRISVASVIVLGLVWLTAFYLLRDPGRVRAIDLYQLLKPGMTKTAVDQVLTNAGPSSMEIQGDGIFDIDGRYFIFCLFDDNGGLRKKVAVDFEAKPSSLPIGIESLMEKLGLPVGRFIRESP